MNRCGIYKIANKLNGKFYIGASCNVRRRFAEHRSRKKKCGCRIIWRAIRKYGPENFSFEIIELCVVNSLYEREVYWIAKLNPPYNRSRGGLGNLGSKPSPEMRERLSKAGKLQWANMTEAQKQRVIKFQLKRPPIGHPVPDCVRRKISTALTGRPLPMSVRLKMSKAQRVSMRGNQNGNKEVIQFSKSGSEITRFESIKSAARSVSVNPSTITKHIKGFRKSAGGYVWKLAA